MINKDNQMLRELTRKAWRAYDQIRSESSVEDALYLPLGIITLKWINETSKINGFIVRLEATWDYIIKQGSQINMALKNAGTILERDNQQLREIFTSLLFITVDKTQLSDWVEIMASLDGISFEKQENQELMADFMEWYIEFLSTKGSRYINLNPTPSLVRKIAIDILDIKENTQIADMAVESGGFFTEIKSNLRERNLDINTLKFYGQEFGYQVYLICRLNLIANGIITSQIYLRDNLNQPLLDENNKLQEFDYIVSNIPQHPIWLDPYNQILESILTYGIPSKSLADWAYIQYILAATKDTGKSVAVVNKGTLLRSSEAKIRERIIQDDKIEAVISLPQNSNSISHSCDYLVVFNKNKDEQTKGKVLFIDGAKLTNTNKAEDHGNQKVIDKIVDIYKCRVEEEGFSKLVLINMIQENNANLIPMEYITMQSLKEDLEEMIPLSKIAEITRGVQVTPRELELLKQSDNKGYYFLNLADIQDDKILYNDQNLIKPKNEKWPKLYEVQFGDIILTSRGTVIKSAIVEENSPKAIISANLIYIRVDKAKYDPHLLKFYLDSPLGQCLIEGLQTGTAAKVINPNNLSQLPIPNIEISKQRKIILKLRTSKEKYEETIKKAQVEYEEQINNAYSSLGILQSIKQVITRTYTL